MKPRKPKPPTQRQVAKKVALAFEQMFAPQVKVFVPTADRQTMTTASAK